MRCAFHAQFNLRAKFTIHPNLQGRGWHVAGLAMNRTSINKPFHVALRPKDGVFVKIRGGVKAEVKRGTRIFPIAAAILEIMTVILKDHPSRLD